MNNWHVSGIIVYLFFYAFSAYAVPGSLTYQGRIKNADGLPLEVNGVKFEFAIVNPTGSCILYRETSGSLDMRNSGGVFDVPIGPGTKNYPADPGFKLLDSFTNSTTFNCEGGGTYTPVTDDKRLLRVQFYDGTGWKLISPDSEIRSVPFAGHAKIAQTANSLGSNVASDFVLKSAVPLCAAGQYLRHIAPAGTFECTAPSVAGGNVTGNITGSSAGFTGNLSGDVSGTQTATSVDKIKGVALDMTGIASGKVLKYNGTSWVPADDTGTVGGITALNGDVSSTGNPTATVTLNDSIVSSAKIVDGTIVDADISSSASIADSKLATISTAGKVSGNAITSGTIGGSTALNTTGSVTANSMSTGTLGVNNLQIYKTGNGNKVTITVPASLSPDYSLQLPSSAGTSGQVLSTDGSGILSWINPATGSVTSVTATAPLASSGGATPVISLNTSGVQTGQTLVYNGTQWDVQYFGMGQLRSTVTGTSQIPASCSTADKTLTWSAITDSFSCTTIAIANTQVTGLGTASTKNFGTSAGNLVELDGSAKIPVSLLPQGAGGSLVDGGNSTGAAISVGTNDANALSLETNNAVRMTINSAGNVGIGTTNPGSLLEVYNSSTATVTAKTSNTFPNQTSLFIGADSNGAVFQVGTTTGNVPLNITHMYNQPIAFRPNNFEMARITTAGLGVGTTTVTNMLDVNGRAAIGSYAGTAAPSNGLIVSGNVGIGTASPGSLLDVRGETNIKVSGQAPLVVIRDDASNGSDPILSLRRTRSDATAPSSSFAGALALWLEGFTNNTLVRAGSIQWGWETNQTDDTTSRDSYISFKTLSNNSNEASYGDERMRITSEGNVGIGTTAPLHKLSVSGGLSLSPTPMTATTNAATATNGGVRMENDSDYGGLTFLDSGVDRKDMVLYFGDNTNDNLRIMGTSSTNGHVLEDRMIITNAGNVGIGTTTPETPLNVVETTDITSATAGGAILVHTAATHQLRIDSNEIQTSLNGAPSALTINTFGGLVQVGGIFQPTTDNSFTLGASTKRWSAVYATNGTIQTSDRRLKKDIQDLNLGLRFITSLRPVSFKWRSDEHSSAQTHWGLIAQELHEQVNKEGADNVGVVSKNDSEYYGVNYSELVGPLINSVKELDIACKMSEQQNQNLNAQVALQDRRLASVEGEVISLKKENAELKSRLEKLEKLLEKQSIQK
ncbi:tail fiber domain-containing protein [Bdellovibrio bacteriovorus]|uniref:tail fiber domain-containing protein n=1 Tax=Bdellovibrio bacteriovorus TaxID=959 RepID=UPI0035A848AF